MDNEEAFQKFLLHDVLEGGNSRMVIPEMSRVRLDEIYPDSRRLAVKANGDNTDLHTITTGQGQANVLIQILPNSRYVEKLGSKSNDRHREIELALERTCGLQREQDYMFIAIHPILDNGRMSPSPTEYLLSIDESAFHNVAMEMLRKLADARKGSDLLDMDAADYTHQLAFENSDASRTVTKIMTYAKPDEQEWGELRDIANASENYEFNSRIATLPEAPRAIFGKRARPPEGQSDSIGM